MLGARREAVSIRKGEARPSRRGFAFGEPVRFRGGRRSDPFRRRTIGAAFLGWLAWFACLAWPVPAANRADLPLIDAVRNRDSDSVSRLLSEGVALDAAQPDGTTALAWAVRLQDRETANRLLAAGASADTRDDYGDTPLTLACANGDAHLIEILLSAGADPNAVRWNGETPLMLAAETGRADSVRQLVSHGAELDATEVLRGQTALMWAATEGHADVVEVLLQEGANVNAASKTGFTALAFATARNDRRSLGILLAAGADPDAQVADGSLPINIAAAYGHTQSVEMLLAAGGRFSASDRLGRTPLYSAARAGQGRAVELLLDAGANPNRRTTPVEDLGSNRNLRRPDGEDTPLLAAALGGHLEAMRRLVAAGADPQARTQDGATLLMQAARSASLPVVEYAFTLDKDLTATTGIGRTVMHAAVIQPSYGGAQEAVCEVIRFLARHGAELDAVDAGGRTPISTADVWPLEKASLLLYELIRAAGREPKILPTDLR